MEDKDKMTDDKFILMGLDDAGDVADILRNKTAKKILDFLAEVKEASEKDISDGLEMPINTVEYNLKKLINAGFVKKSKNFFWSVKGKKIEVYKLAKKHIIISPNKKPSLNYIKSLLPLILVLAVFLVAIVGLFMFPDEEEGPVRIFDSYKEDKLMKFESSEELKGFVEENAENFGIYFGGALRASGALDVEFAMESAATDVGVAKSAETSGAASEYSETNIQVEGVDEADIVKNDGKYIYVVSGNKVVIVDAYPPEEMKVLSEIKFNKSIREIFVNEDRLVIFGYSYGPVYGLKEGVECMGVGCVRPSGPMTLVYIYDVSDRENPELENMFEAEGNYVDSRMIGDYVYVISTKYVNIKEPIPPIYYADGVERRIAASDVYYFPYPDRNYVFTSISAINLDDFEYNSKVYLTGGTRTLYVSTNNIYLSYQKRVGFEYYLNKFVEDVALKILPSDLDEEVEEILEKEDKYYYNKLSEIQKLIYDHSLSLKGREKEEFDSKLVEMSEEFEVEMSKEMEKTVVHKISIDEDEIYYEGSGEAPGRVLNQFSMDEYKGYFRIATTTGSSWRDTSLNHIYVLDKDLEIVGSVEDLAQGERIYSARFLGKRAYLVTFKQVDPLFVVDLSNPENPKVLGYLKVTGYSSYLHPYDEDHIIGIGKEATEEGRVQGVKIALFDVSDVENPKEISKYEVGAEWSDVYKSYSDSEALNEHKAFLFDKEKELLVIPISYTKYLGSDYRNREYWQGAYVFNINLEDGLELRGKVSHQEVGEESYNRWYRQIRRSLYMDDILYTISNYKVKANNLIGLDKIKEVIFGEEGKDTVVY